jgi:hypothetical protein
VKAIALKKQGKLPLANRMYEKALAVTVAAFGELHPDVARAYNNMAVVHGDLKKYHEALSLHHKVNALSFLNLSCFFLWIVCSCSPAI